MLLDAGETPAPGMHVERGILREAVYAGMITRYLVGLEQGEELVVVRQNSAGAPQGEPAGERGRPATVAWHPEHTFAIHGRRKEEG